MQTDCGILGPPLPWGEVDARSASGEGVRSIEQAYALTPTLSPRERELTARVARLSAMRSRRFHKLDIAVGVEFVGGQLALDRRQGPDVTERIHDGRDAIAPAGVLCGRAHNRA